MDYWEKSDFNYGHNKWDYDGISKKQKKYIIDLVSAKKGYKLMADLNNLTRSEAASLIQALQEDNENKLVKKRILAKVMSKDEFVKRVMADKGITKNGTDT